MKSKNPLSLVEIGPSVQFANTLKRIFRFAWVFAANGCVAWLMFKRLRSVGFPSSEFDFQLWFEFVFEVILPVTGIALELANWNFARWVNVGSLTAAGCFWLMAAVWDRADPFFGILLIAAFGLLIVAGITEIVYRTTRSEFSDTAPL